MSGASATSGLSTSRPALAVILARAGSKGLPGKNRMMIAGKPCAQWTIEHAMASEMVGMVALSTDDQELMGLGERMGIACVRRSTELAGDRATVDAAARECVGIVERKAAVSSATPILILYANVPVRPVGLIDRAVKMLADTRCDSVQSYGPAGKFHPWWMARVDEQTGAVRPWEGDVLNHGVYRRQDLPPCFVPDGGVIAVTRRALFCEIPGVAAGPHAFFGMDRRGIVNGEGAVVDIDSAVDAAVAEAMLTNH
jgi:CMP-N,N'-diacetyllegionaminic acid synthase